MDDQTAAGQQAGKRTTRRAAPTPSPRTRARAGAHKRPTHRTGPKTTGLTDKQLRERLNLDRQQLQSLLARGLPHTELSGRRQYDPTAVRDWLERAGFVAPPPPASKFVPERIDRILAAARAGQHRATCARAGGIDYATLKRWLRRAKDDPAYARFQQDFLDAEHEGEVTRVSEVQTAGATDWRAAAWYLERRYPERWGRRDKLTVTPNPGQPPAATADELLKRIESEIEKREKEQASDD